MTRITSNGAVLIGLLVGATAVAGDTADGAPLARIRLADPVSGTPGQTSLNGFAKLCRCDANDN